MVTDSLQNELVERLWRALTPADHAPFLIDGPPTLESAYAVSEFAAASIAVAGLAASRYLTPDATEPVIVDNPLASAWFRTAVTVPGHDVSPWDSLAGDYATADGFLRLHTNAPHHKAAALRVLGSVEEVKNWRGDDLETAIVDAGGCAAVMRSWGEWASHPQGAAVLQEPLVGWSLGRQGADGGFRVLDLTRVIAGPVATRFLAGFGADVLRIDPPWWEEPALEADMTLGKRTARLDFTKQRDVLEQLIAAADVVVHGYRADALDSFDFDAIRPGIVDIAIDAYGWHGPWRNRRGFDSLVQMSTGLAEEGMHWFDSDVPTPLPVQALDHATGYLAVAAAFTGLADRRETGSGSRARLSLARTAVELAGVGRGDMSQPTPIQVGSSIKTAWGAGQLLPPPLTVGGRAPVWKHMPRPLGSDAPQWVE